MFMCSANFNLTYGILKLILCVFNNTGMYVCMAAFQNVSCFVFEQSIVFLNGAVQNIYNVFYFKTSSMCILLKQLKSNQASVL